MKYYKNNYIILHFRSKPFSFVHQIRTKEINSHQTKTMKITTYLHVIKILLHSSHTVRTHILYYYYIFYFIFLMEKCLIICAKQVSKSTLCQQQPSSNLGIGVLKSEMAFESGDLDEACKELFRHISLLIYYKI